MFYSSTMTVGQSARAGRAAADASSLTVAALLRRRLHARRTTEGELTSHEPIRVCPHHLRLAPDRGGQPGGQRRRDRPRARPGAPTATSCSSRNSASRATPAPTCSASRRCWTPAFGPSCGSPRRPSGRAQLVVVGAPIPVGNSLFNCAVVIDDGAIRGIVPKQYLPNYKEFYESRWFSPATGNLPAEIELGGRRVPFGIDLLFEAKSERRPTAEMAASSWASRSARTSGCRCLPAALQAMAGATVLLNLSASNETIGKSQYRTDLVVGQSGRTIAAYAMAGCGPSESTTDVVFGGHCLIAENGRLLAESPRVGDGQPIRRDSYCDHPRRRRRQAAQPTAASRPASTTARSLVKPFRPVPFSLAETHGGPEARGAGHAVRAGGRTRAAPPLRRDLRHPVRGPGQANRAAPARHAAQYRHLGRPRFHARASGRGRRPATCSASTAG